MIKQDYKLEQLWMPYILFFQQGNYRSETVNTDSRGFRFSVKDSENIAEFENKDENPVCLLVGSSVVFGIGASCDRWTIPAILNDKMAGHLWLNMGGRAFNSTQELFLFMIYLPYFKEYLDRVVILSGVNSLALFHTTKRFSADFGSFFFESEYGRNIERLNYQLPVNKKYQVKGKKYKQDLLCLLERDLSNWKLLSEAIGFKLCYLLQPYADWIDKKLHEDEFRQFSRLDRIQGKQWKRRLKESMKNEYDWYVGALGNICRDYDIRFADANLLLYDYNIDGMKLFIDRVHLTDQGNELMAEIIVKVMDDKKN